MTAEGEGKDEAALGVKGASWGPGESQHKGVGEGAVVYIWPLIMIAGKLPELWLASQQVREQAWTRGEGEETKAPYGQGCKLSLYIPVFLVNLIYKGLKGLSGRGMVETSRGGGGDHPLHGGCGTIATATHGDPKSGFSHLLGLNHAQSGPQRPGRHMASLLPLRPLVHPATSSPQANLEPRWGKQHQISNSS